MSNDFNDPITLFITWTAYGSWLPGDSRGWKHLKKGELQPQPRLEEWCKGRMKEKAVLLDEEHRRAVESVIRKHSQIRGWELHVVSVRSNHVHVAATVIPKTGIKYHRAADGIKRVRDELKANATRVLRRCENPIQNEKVWTKGGDIQFVDTEHDLEQVVIYISEAQDRMDRGKQVLTNRRLAPCRSQSANNSTSSRCLKSTTELQSSSPTTFSSRRSGKAVRTICSSNATSTHCSTCRRASSTLTALKANLLSLANKPRRENFESEGRVSGHTKPSPP